MKDKIFVDTNILVYAHDLDAGLKHEIARSKIIDLWEDATGVLSTQVLQEFYITITRKIINPLTPAKTRGIIVNYLAWQVELNDAQTILLASEFEERHKISFWDALIIAAASRTESIKILTEDLNDGQIIEGIMIENPFKELLL